MRSPKQAAPRTLPSRAPPPRPDGADAPLAEAARLATPRVANPFAPGREVAFARVTGRALEAVGVRDGDHVALLRRDVAEHGDLAAVIGADGRAALWKVYPEADGWRLSVGVPHRSRWVGCPPRVQGVVVGVLRKFR